MEDVIEVYHRPPDPKHPLVCLDETTKQLLKETRVKVPAASGRPERIDYEYEQRYWEYSHPFYDAGPALGLAAGGSD